MVWAIHRKTLELRTSADATELPGGPDNWLINPDLTVVEKVPRKYWKLSDGFVQEMTVAEKAEVDARELADHREAKLSVLREKAGELLAGEDSRYLKAKEAVRRARTEKEVDAVELEVM